MESDKNHWRLCSSCKKPILFNAKYWVCSVSTCVQKRTNWAFCTVECWDAHVPKMNHRESWAVEKFSPGRQAWEKELADREREQAEAKPREAKSRPDAPPPKPAAPAKTVVIRRPRQS